MPQTKAKIITKPQEGTRTVLAGGDNFNGPFIRGNGPTTYICGLCRSIIVENVFHGQVRNIVFLCPKCLSYNEIP